MRATATSCGSEFEQAVGPQWGELNIGHLYQVLERLTATGSSLAARSPSRDRPDRVVYRLTKAGRSELEPGSGRRSSANPATATTSSSSSLAASRLGRSELELVLRTQRAAYLSELVALASLQAEHANEPLVELLIGAAIGHTEANLAALERAEERADDLGRSAARDRRAPERQEGGAEAAGSM